MATARERRLPQLQLTLDMPSCSSRYPALAPIAAPPKPSTSASTTSVARHGEFRLSDLERLAILGRGNGRRHRIYKVSHRHRGTSALYALKVLHCAEPAAVAEAEVACCLDSPYIVQCHSVLPTAAGDVSLLLELMDGGSLDSLVVGHGGLQEAEVAELLAHSFVAGRDVATSRRALRGVIELRCS